ncbi:glucosamine-6-phosphate deaminase [Oscillospiraceae bacterium OttesenSCG-928-G22]|nr:glucosamine-6-phosphate deaminase [Oscillospiraceae bacterium OttesenSCG-928-G22]
MHLYETSDYSAMSLKAAQILAAQIALKPKSVLGLATGSTPEGLYRHLVEWSQNGSIDFSNITSINLDEYIGLPPDHPQSYRKYMQDNLFQHVGVQESNIHIPNGLETDAEAECARYDAVIEQAGGIDLQLLGMGQNGHIGFNEPGDEFIPGTHAVDLTESTIQANKRFFEKESDVPRRAYTMGIRAIMQARRVLVVVSGPEKARALKQAFFGPITPRVPASILQLHKNVILVADKAALSEL